MSEDIGSLLDAYRDAINFTNRAMQMRSDSLEDDGILFEREARSALLSAFETLTKERDEARGGIVAAVGVAVAAPGQIGRFIKAAEDACRERDEARSEVARIKGEVERLRAAGDAVARHAVCNYEPNCCDAALDAWKEASRGR